MHELSLLENVLDLVVAEHCKQAFSRVRVIRLRLGTLGHAAPEALRFCFDAVAAGTIADGACLDIEMVAAEGWCPSCCITVALEDRFAACPQCHAAPLQILSGEELRLAEIEVE